MFIVIITSGLATTPLGWSQQHLYTRTIDICPTEMTYSELAALVGRIREFIDRANAALKTTSRAERIVLSDGEIDYSVESDFSTTALSLGPDVATRVGYTISIRDSDAPISKFSLLLGDRSRQVITTGTGRTYVDGLTSLVQADFEELGCEIGGSTHRMLMALILMLVGIIGLVVLDSHLQRTFKIVFASGAVTSWIAVALMLATSWPPGIAVSVDGQSFGDTWGPVLGTLASFCTLFFTIRALVQTVAKKFTPSNPEGPQS